MSARRRLPPLVAMLAALALVPSACATPILSGQAVGESFETGEAVQQGRTEFVHLHDVAGAAGTLRLTVKGAVVTASQFTDTSPQAAAAGIEQDIIGLRGSLGQNEPAVHRTANGELTLGGLQPYYVLAVIADTALDRTSALSQTDGVTLDRPVLTEQGITTFAPQSSPLLPAGDPSDDAVFAHPIAAGQRIVTTAASASALDLTGSFTLELFGVSGRLAGTDGAWDLESGRWTEPAAPGAPSDSVRTVRESFLRLKVQDGSLTAAITSAELLQFSDVVVTTESSSMALEGATGSFILDSGGEQRVAGSRFTIDGRTRAQAEPSDAGVRLAFTGLDASGAPRQAPAATALRIPEEMAVALTALFLLAAAAAGILAYALRRPATMADVESRLVGGRYLAAARVAGRVLRRRPDSEEAMISRAVALTKAGRPRRVVRELTAHMAQRDPSDGVLHYVLGLAYLDLGEQAPGEAALREAMRRTPALAPQVKPRLPPSSAQQGSRGESPSWDGSAADSHGYA